MDNNEKYEKVKLEIASELGINLTKGYNGHLSCKDVGKIGGIIGGNMVKTMVHYAEEELSKYQ